MNTLEPIQSPAESRLSGAALQPLPARRAANPVAERGIDILPPIVGAIVGAAILVVMALTLLGQAGGLSALSGAFLGEQSMWYLSRASAFVSYILLWWSMILGLSITNRLARIWPGGPAATDLHEHASLLGIVFAVMHALALLGDHYIGFSLSQIVIPFASANFEPFWVGMGQIGLYLMMLVTVTFYMRRWIGRAWRSIHVLSFAVFAMALLHGIVTGTDTSALWAFWMYVATGLSVLAMTIYRVVARRRPQAALTLGKN